MFWSSRFGFGAHGSMGKHHDRIFWACCDKCFWACCDKGFWVTRVFCACCDVCSFLSISNSSGPILTFLKGEGTLCYII